MDRFYKYFKHAISKLPEENEPKDAWSKFQKHRSTQDNVKGNGFPWLLWTSLGLIALLLSSNIYWMSSNNNIKNEMYTSIIHDTIIITKIVTLETKKNINNNEEIEIAGLKTMISSSESLIKSLQKQITSQRYDFSVQMKNIRDKYMTTEVPIFNILDKYNKYKEDEIASILEKDKETLKRKLWLSQLVSPLKISKLQYRRPWPPVSPYLKVQVQKSRFNLLEIIKPKSFSLNANVGMFVDTEQEMLKTQGLAASLKVSSHFSTKVRGHIGLSQHFGSGELKEMTAYSNIPTITIPEGSTLKEIKIKQQSSFISAGLDYLVKTNSLWRPYLGVGYMQSISIEDKFKFEINSPIGEIYISPEHAVKQKGKKFLTFSTGTDINLSTRIDARIGIQYLSSLTDHNPSTLLVDSGIYFHF